MTKSEILSVAKPILFNTGMARAILEGRKTVTRRVVKPQPLWFNGRHYCFADETCPKKWEDCDDIVSTYQYQPGDILYVRETWRQDAGRYMYRADYSDIERLFYQNGKEVLVHWRPSIHMPKEAARIFLRVTDVHVERLHEIDDNSARAEGIREFFLGMGESGFATSLRSDTIFFDGPVGAFADLWNSTIKPADRDKCSWAANPWVWVIEFERLKVDHD